MIYSYSQCKEKLGSLYKMQMAMKKGDLYQLEKGVYSDKEYESELAIISFKYPMAVITMNSAFYFHNLTDTIPEKITLATTRGKSKIADSRVIQKFENSDFLTLGAEHTEYNGVKIFMYNKERMLIELLRNKNTLPFDYYKEIISNYRKQIDELDIRNVQDYAEVLPKSQMILRALQMEVF